MSKLFEAMEKANQDHSSLRLSPANDSQVVIPPSLSFEAEMFALYGSLDEYFDDLSQKVILFVGVEGGEGTSTIVSGLARVAAERLDRNVAVLDTDILSPLQHKLFGVSGSIGWNDMPTNTAQLEQAIHHTTVNGLSIVPVSASNKRASRSINGQNMDDLLFLLRTRFNLVLVDCAPVSALPDSITLSRKVDGVILVIAADTTPWTAAHAMHRQIASAGGNVIGVVFNKRRYYVPSSIRQGL